MADTMERTARRHHLGGPRSLTANVARTLGVSPNTAEQFLWGPPTVRLADRSRKVVQVLKHLGRPAAAQAFIDEIALGLREGTPLPLTPALWRAAQEADAAEEVAELCYQLEPSDTNLDALIRAKRREIGHEMACCEALEQERGRRRVS